jgi:hypothetical protein
VLIGAAADMVAVFICAGRVFVAEFDLALDIDTNTLIITL